MRQRCAVRVCVAVVVACASSHGGAAGVKLGVNSSFLAGRGCSGQSVKEDPALVRRRAGFVGGAFAELSVGRAGLSFGLFYEQRGWREDMRVDRFDGERVITETEEDYLKIRQHYFTFPLLFRMPVVGRRVTASLLGGPMFAFLYASEETYAVLGGSVATRQCSSGDSEPNKGILCLCAGARLAVPLERITPFVDFMFGIDAFPRTIEGEGAEGRANVISVAAGCHIPAFNFAHEPQKGGAVIPRE
ncbi:MAG: outer membrane beta-barrel protein [Chitinivibrionales bacterium]|nr:outer membrane beta-barrel protein [Chitinivibrionales bacterium]MBD3394061.1 outer membrane beta-barrel protein [Chitinivibrionales bacterium]